MLDEENALEICVITVPEEYQYVDHIVIATGRSGKHLLSIAEYVRKIVSDSIFHQVGKC